MAKVWHPSFKKLSIDVDDERVAAYVAAGWLSGKSTSRKPKAAKPKAENESAKTEAEETDVESANETPSTGDGEA